MRLIDKPGLAPIRPLLDDPSVTEIMINGPHQVFVERDGRMQEVGQVFATPAQLDLLVDNLVVAAGRGLNARTPMADFRLEDGSRVNVAIAPVSLQGPAVTIRKFTAVVKSLLSNDIPRLDAFIRPSAEIWPNPRTWPVSWATSPNVMHPGWVLMLISPIPTPKRPPPVPQNCEGT